MKWGRQPYALQPSYASERTWITCRKWSWRAAYFGGDTWTLVRLGSGEGYSSLVGAMVQFYTAIPLNVSQAPWRALQLHFRHVIQVLSLA